MSKIDREKLNEIVKNLKTKQIIKSSARNKNILLSKKKQNQNSNDINSDSEKQALELFQNQVKQHQSENQSQPHDQQQKSDQIQKQIKVENGNSSSQKQVRSEKKKVTFALNNLIYSMNADKKWKDKIYNQKKGKFQLDEQRILGDAVGQFLAANQISFDEFSKLISSGSNEKKILRKEKFFNLLSSVLPQRSPESCYKYIVRNFNTFNRQGQWTKEEVDKLIALVEKFGRKWTLIGKELNRTNDNVYDKFRSLGQQNMEGRIKSIWKLKQLITFLIQIEKQTKVQFLNNEIQHELQNSEMHDFIQINEHKQHKYNSKKFIFHNLDLVKRFINPSAFKTLTFEQIKWKKILAKIETKNIYDCRVKFIQLMQIMFQSNTNIEFEILQFLESQKVKEERQINWKLWNNKQHTPEEAKNRYLISKKMIEGRTVKPFSEILREMKHRLTKKLIKQ